MLPRPRPGCLAIVLAVIYDRDAPMGQIGDTIEDRALKLVANVAANYGAIWRDPPDPAFEQVTPLEATDHSATPSAGVLPDALAGVLGPLADEAALSKALLHSVERYQGAQAAGDGDWALVHARAARDLSATLGAQISSATAVSDLRAAVASKSAELDSAIAVGNAFTNRVRAMGFSPDERRILANLGQDANEIAAVESDLASRVPVLLTNTGHVLEKLDTVVAARAAGATALSETAARWSEVVTNLEARTSIRRQAPVADAGGPYSGSAGAAIALDGSASTTPAGTSITGYAWDLDGDGQFDDGTGSSASVTFPSAGPRIVGLQVTNDAGRTAVDYANVVVSAGNRPPAISASSPAAATSGTAGQSRPSTARDARPTPFGPTRRPAPPWSRSWASSRGRPCAGWRRTCWPRPPPSTGRCRPGRSPSADVSRSGSRRGGGSERRFRRPTRVIWS